MRRVTKYRFPSVYDVAISNIEDQASQSNAKRVTSRTLDIHTFLIEKKSAGV